jgi:hypothetical protein
MIIIDCITNTLQDVSKMEHHCSRKHMIFHFFMLLLTT